MNITQEERESLRDDAQNIRLALEDYEAYGKLTRLTIAVLSLIADDLDRIANLEKSNES